MSWLSELAVSVRTGDLFSAPVEALACTVTVDLAAYGRLSQHLLQYCRAEIARQLGPVLDARPERRLALGEALAFVPGRCLPGGPRQVIVVALWARENDYTANLVYRCTINVLRQSFACGTASLALPILKVPLPMLGETVAQVLRDLDGLKGAEAFPLRELHFISQHPGHVEFLRTYLERHLP